MLKFAKITAANIGAAIGYAINSRVAGDNTIQAVLEFAVVQSIQHYNATPAISMLDAMVSAVTAKESPAFTQKELDCAISFVVKHGYLQVNSTEAGYEIKYVKPDFDGGDMAKPVLADYPSWKKGVAKPKIRAELDAFEMISALLARHEKNSAAKNRAEEYGFTPEVLALLAQVKGKAEFASLAQKAARASAV